tara:strand:- start:5397 stop:6404 length:1008 start_codon:yes stop_codon:yes gene_type:complete
MPVHTLSEDIDSFFTATWYEIQKEAIDNILDSLAVFAALKARGSFVPQTGERFIERTIKYGEKSASAVAKGDTLSSGEDDIETAAFWTWRYHAVHIQRSVQDDQQNAGSSKIKSLVATKLQAARDAMSQKLESDLFRAIQTDETGKEIQGLNDMVPPQASQTADSYGKIDRPATYDANNEEPATGNTWWGPMYEQLTIPIAVNLVSNMRQLYNRCTKNIETPNLIISRLDLFETYEDIAVDAAQIVKREGGLADLGFNVLLFKGKDWIYTTNTGLAANNMLMINTDYTELVYDPNLWFDMTEWKPVSNQLERIAHIVSAMNLVSGQLRRHGRIYP